MEFNFDLINCKQLFFFTNSVYCLFGLKFRLDII